MAKVCFSKAKIGQKGKKMKGKKVMPLALTGIRTQDLSIMSLTLYQLSYWRREEILVKNSGIWNHHVHEIEPKFKNFTK